MCGPEGAAEAGTAEIEREERAPGVTKFPHPADTEERAVQYLRAGDPDQALLLLQFLDETETKDNLRRFLRAWALALQAQTHCSLLHALEALSVLESGSELAPPVDDLRARTLQQQLYHLVGLDKSFGVERSYRVREDFSSLRERFLAQTATADEVRRFASQAPWFVRQIAERDLLAELASELDRMGSAPGDPNDGVGRATEFLQIVAEELEPRDRVLRESLGSLLRIWRLEPDRLPAAASALHNFSLGARAYDQQDFDRAAALLATAAPVLADASMPLELWARFYMAIGRFYEDAEDGLRLFEEIRGLAQERGYPALAGRASWLAGSGHLISNRFDKALEYQRQAHQLLDRAGGSDASAFILVLLAEAESRRGNHLAAWKHRLGAFREVPNHEGLRRQIAMYWEAATALDRAERYDLSGPLHEQALFLSRRWRSPLGMSVSLHSHAMWLLAQGQADEALVELQEAADWIDRMQEGSLKEERIRSQAGYIGIAVAALQPKRGVELLDDAIRSHIAAGRILDVLETLPHHTEALRLLERWDEAESQLRHGLELFEDAYVSAEDSQTRADLLFQARRVGGSLVGLLFDQNRFREARDTAESLKRQRYENLGTSPTGIGPVDALHRQEVAWLSSFSTTETTYWWVSNGSELISATRHSTGTLNHRIEAFRAQIRHGAPRREIDTVLEQLFEMLAEPLGLDRVGRIHFVPDQDTLLVPLSALRNPKTSKYLIETAEISVVAGFLPPPRRDPRRSANAPALVVAVSGADSEHGLPALPETEAEARLVAELLGERSSVVSGLSIEGADLLRRLELGPDIFHFAGHAVQNRDRPHESFFSLGTSGEILGLRRLRDVRLESTRLAVLSSCTSLDAWGERKDASFGLAGALVAAGVHSVVASVGPVQDDATGEFLSSFYRAYGGERPRSRTAPAFRSAILELIQRDDPVASPATWAFWNVLEALPDGAPDEASRNFHDLGRL